MRDVAAVPTSQADQEIQDRIVIRVSDVDRRQLGEFTVAFHAVFAAILPLVLSPVSRLKKHEGC